MILNKYNPPEVIYPFLNSNYCEIRYLGRNMTVEEFIESNTKLINLLQIEITSLENSIKEKNCDTQ